MTKQQVLYQGAEAKIIRSQYHNHDVVKKQRVHKRYRIKEIDELLIQRRTKEEAKVMALARMNGVNVPLIYDVDLLKGCITFEFVDGSRIKDIFDTINDEQRKMICYQIGSQIALLHNTEIIHGDLTTSNMIFKDEKVYFIDFGLSEINQEVEARGVDLHLLMEALESTHSQHASFFKYVFDGYRETYTENTDEVKRKIDDIIRRGRYR
ncbi:MAG: Kae1-associated serine/threonine protein kinase [Candidatus Thermoplasmatota archaeon]|nr:Kae1-associated serine/threonine protein kinase [Candidatus Thermoplasmatota archaeon]